MPAPACLVLPTDPFDKRGTGMSDRGSQIFTLEQRMHDVQAILDAVGSERAALFGVSEGGPMSVLYAASHPERTAAHILYGCYAKRAWAPDYPLAGRRSIGSKCSATSKRIGAPRRGLTSPCGHRAWRTTRRRPNAWPPIPHGRDSGAALAIMNMNCDIDVRQALPAISVPTLILHRTGERVIEVEHARYMAQHIPDAKLVELPGQDHVWWLRGGDELSIRSRNSSPAAGMRTSRSGYWRPFCSPTS